jgi:hypothetical protein
LGARTGTSGIRPSPRMRYSSFGQEAKATRSQVSSQHPLSGRRKPVDSRSPLGYRRSRVTTIIVERTAGRQRVSFQDA